MVQITEVGIAIIQIIPHPAGTNVGVAFVIFNAVAQTFNRDHSTIVTFSVIRGLDHARVGRRLEDQNQCREKHGSPKDYSFFHYVILLRFF